MTKSCMAWMLAAVMLLMAGCKGVGTEQCDSKQEEMKNLLFGGMGDDMKAVLNGEKTIDMPKTEMHRFKIKSFFKKLFKKF